jgi:hypothetical protein
MTTDPASDEVTQSLEDGANVQPIRGCWFLVLEKAGGRWGSFENHAVAKTFPVHGDMLPDFFLSKINERCYVPDEAVLMDNPI